jgi:hypothetical protein
LLRLERAGREERNLNVKPIEEHMPDLFPTKAKEDVQYDK